MKTKGFNLVKILLILMCTKFFSETDYRLNLYTTLLIDKTFTNF